MGRQHVAQALSTDAGRLIDAFVSMQGQGGALFITATVTENTQNRYRPGVALCAIESCGHPVQRRARNDIAAGIEGTDTTAAGGIDGRNMPLARSWARLGTEGAPDRAARRIFDLVKIAVGIRSAIADHVV